MFAQFPPNHPERFDQIGVIANNHECVSLALKRIQQEEASEIYV